MSSSTGAERAAVRDREAAAVPLFDSAIRRAAPTEELARLVHGSDLVRELVLRNLRVMYKRSSLGVLWSLLHPLLLMAALTFVFSSLFRNATPHFALHAFVGLVFWGFFAQGTVWAMSDFVHGGAILRRVRVPASAFPVSSVATGAVNLVLTLPVILAIAAFEGHAIVPALVCLPLALACAVAFTAGVALLLAAAAAYFADVIEMYRAGILAWMYLTPVFYPLEAIPEGVRAWLWWNPLVPLLELFRRPIVQGAWPELGLAGTAVAIALASLVGGFLVFADRADDIVYRV